MILACLVVAVAVADKPQQLAPDLADELTVAHCPYDPPALPAETETALRATLLVRSPKGTGSAVFISPDGFALTAAHVVAHSASVELVTHTGAVLTAQVVRLNEQQDVALLKAELKGPSPCLSPLDTKADLGSDIFILGSPAGEELSFSVSKGIVSGYRDFDQMHFVQLDASVNPGNSGGPAVNTEGAIVGIASWKVSDVSMEGLAFAVPANVALHALRVQRGTQSSTNWTVVAIGAPTTEAPSPPSPADVAAPRTFEPRQVRRTRARKGLIIAGSILAASGVATIAGTAISYKRKDRMTELKWQLTKGFNTAGWALAGGGAAMLLAGLVLPKRVKPKDDVKVVVAPSVRGVQIQGAF